MNLLATLTVPIPEFILNTSCPLISSKLIKWLGFCTSSAAYSRTPLGTRERNCSEITNLKEKDTIYRHSDRNLLQVLLEAFIQVVMLCSWLKDEKQKPPVPSPQTFCLMWRLSLRVLIGSLFHSDLPW